MPHGASSNPWCQGRPGWDLGVLTAGYCLLALCSIAIARQPGAIATLWIANGFALAIIATAPVSRTWMLLAGAALGNLSANRWYGDPWLTSLAFVPANLLEVMAAVYLLRRVDRFHQFAQDPRTFLRVILAGVMLPPLLGATLGAFTLLSLFGGVYQRIWLDWYVGATLASAGTVPLVLALRMMGPSQLRERWLDARAWLAAVVLGVVTLLALTRLDYPFIWISATLLLFAFTLPRVHTFFHALVVILVLAVALGQGWHVPVQPRHSWLHNTVHLAGLMSVLPAQLVAVVSARQRAIEEMLSAVSGRTNDVVVYADMANVYRWVNHAHARYWVQTPAEVLGRTWRDNIPRGLYDGVFAALIDKARAGGFARQQSDVDFPGTGLRRVDILIQPAWDEEGHQIGVLSCVTDITELDQARREQEALARELQESNESLAQFVRVAAHDLREPLNAMRQFVALIEQQQAQELSATSKLYFSHVRQGADRMLALLNDVLQFVRLDVAPESAKALVSLDEVLRDVSASLSVSLERRGVTLRHEPLGEVLGHHSLLALALQNFVSNAIKFVPPERVPEVRVSATRDAQWCRLTVEDNGIGIDPAKLAELGVPFRRLHARRHFDGTGLGLAIARRIALQHGGRVDIESTPGRGSRFHLVLPLS